MRSRIYQYKIHILVKITNLQFQLTIKYIIIGRLNFDINFQFYRGYIIQVNLNTLMIFPLYKILRLHRFLIFAY